MNEHPGLSHQITDYKSPFHNWEEASSVRSKPHRFLTSEGIGDNVFFTPELVPIVNHPLVKERGDQVYKQILIYHLYAHLDFTENLEHEVVNYVTYKIGRRNIGLDLPVNMIEDAWKLYVDEAYHFKFSADLLSQVERATGVEAPEMGLPKFLRQLHQFIEDVPYEKRDLVYLFFSIVSETLITGTLNVVPQDERVVAAVRQVIGDHAEDEGRHHVYFANLLSKLWVKLSPQDRRLIGPMLPKFIYGFIEPDYEIVRVWLRNLNFPKKAIDTIIEESYPRDQVMQNIRGGAKITLKHFKRSGVFEEPYTEEAFEIAGLSK